MHLWFFRTSWHIKSRNCQESIWNFCVFSGDSLKQKIFSDKKNPFRKYLFQMGFNPLLFLPKLYCFKADTFDEAILSPFRTRVPFIDRFGKSLVRPHSKFVSLYRYSLRWRHHTFWMVHILNWSPLAWSLLVWTWWEQKNIENDDSDDCGDSDCAYQFKRKNTALQTV